MKAALLVYDNKFTACSASVPIIGENIKVINDNGQLMFELKVIDMKKMEENLYVVKTESIKFKLIFQKGEMK